MTFRMKKHVGGEEVAYHEEKESRPTEHRAMISNERAGDFVELDIFLQKEDVLGIVCFVARIPVRSIRI